MLYVDFVRWVGLAAAAAAAAVLNRWLDVGASESLPPALVQGDIEHGDNGRSSEDV